MEHIPEDIKELNEKIAIAKKKTIDTDDAVNSSRDASRFAKGMRMGVELASGTIVGAAIGYILDEIFDFKFIMLLIFTIFGGFAGMLNAYRYVQELNANEEKRG